MPDDHDQPDALPETDATDTAVEQIIPPEQPPMDDAAGGPSIDTKNDNFENTSIDDLTVQGGE